MADPVANQGFEFTRAFKSGGYSQADQADQIKHLEKHSDPVMKFLNKSIAGYGKTKTLFHRKAGESKELAELAERAGDHDAAEKYWLKMEAQERKADRADQIQHYYQDAKDFRKMTAKLGDAGIAVWNFCEQDINGAAQMLAQVLMQAVDSAPGLISGLLDKLGDKLKTKGEQQQANARTAIEETNKEAFDSMRDAVREAHEEYGAPVRQAIREWAEMKIGKFKEDAGIYKQYNKFRYELQFAPKEEIQLFLAKAKMVPDTEGPERIALMNEFVARQEARPLAERFTEQVLNQVGDQQREKYQALVNQVSPEKAKEFMEGMVEFMRNRTTFEMSNTELKTRLGIHTDRLNESRAQKPEGPGKG